MPFMSLILEVKAGHVTYHVDEVIIISLLIWLQVFWLVNILIKSSKKFQIFMRGRIDHFKTDTAEVYRAFSLPFNK